MAAEQKEGAMAENLGEDKGVQANVSKEPPVVARKELDTDTVVKITQCAGAMGTRTPKDEHAVKALYELLKIKKELNEKKKQKKYQNKETTIKDIHSLLCAYGSDWKYEKFRICHAAVAEKQQKEELDNLKAENKVLKAENKVLKAEIENLKAKNKGDLPTEDERLKKTVDVATSVENTDESATEEEQEELGSDESETEDTDKQLNTRMKNMRIKQNETETEKSFQGQYW